jgi:hypothetical protein
VLKVVGCVTPVSLLWWWRRLLMLRQTHKTKGVGFKVWAGYEGFDVRAGYLWGLMSWLGIRAYVWV